MREYKVTGWEIRAALETGTLEIISATGHIPKYFESMREYIDRFFNERQEAKKAGDKIRDLLCKLKLNSLYGKYGANCAEYKDYLLVEPGERCRCEKHETCPLCGFSLDSEGDGYDLLHKPTDHGQYYDVALAASITGYARAILWRAIHASSGVVYCDTDSIMCEKFAGKKGEALGEWKLEARLKNLHIAGKKLYAGQDTESGDWKVAHKGFSKLNTQVNDVIKAAKGEIIEITSLAPSIKLSGAQTFLKRRMRKTVASRK
jgi:DNA polymerase elongation subunit (family B)